MSLLAMAIAPRDGTFIIGFHSDMSGAFLMRFVPAEGEWPAIWEALDGDDITEASDVAYLAGWLPAPWVTADLVAEWKRRWRWLDATLVPQAAPPERSDGAKA